MGNLVLNSLEIRGFRGFRHLQIERLGRVNLIVGKNNVGKSSLLEALRLYARRGYPELIWELLRERNESRYAFDPYNRRPGRHIDVEEALLSLKYLFYGRKDIRRMLEPISIGPIKSPENTLSIAIGWYVTQSDEEGNIKSRLLQPEEYNIVDNPNPRFTIYLGNQSPLVYALDPLVWTETLLRPELKEINNVYVTVDGVNRVRVASLWDGIALTGLEKEVLNSLRIIAPGVEGLTLVNDGVSSARERIPIVKIANIDDPMPLRSLGNGMLRMLGIVLALANARDGMLLIDEIENGLHYSIQSDLWRFIFQVARRLNVQVFAATHSWDCISAFQKAAQEDNQEEGMLIRLEVKNDDIGVTLFDERRLGIAAREQIEVR